MSPSIPSTLNAAAAPVPISEEESVLLADECCVQQEMDDLEHLHNECIWRKGKCTIGGASVTQWAPCRTGPARKKVCIVLQPTIEQRDRKSVV